MKRISEKQKITLTLGQLKKLVRESVSDEEFVDDEPTEDKPFQINDNGVLAKVFYKLKYSKEPFAIPEGVKAIGPYACQRCYCSTIIIPEGVKKICDNAFANSDIETIRIPESVKIIERDAFFDCKNLKTVEFAGDNLIRIEDYAFTNAPIVSIKFPDSLASIGQGAFSCCHRLRDVVLNEGLVNIEAKAFEDTAISHITLPRSLRYLGYHAFYRTGMGRGDIVCMSDKLYGIYGGKDDSIQNSIDY